MNARVAFGCAVVLASSVAVFAWLKSDPPGAAVERAWEQRLDRPQPVKSLASVAALPRASAPVLPHPTTESRQQPHPINAARAAFAEQNSLFLEIERALSARDVARVKQLLEEHEQRLPDFDGGAEARQGYVAMARCIENPGAESRANGERFMAENRASPLRRKVRHACVGPRTPVLLPPG